MNDHLLKTLIFLYLSSVTAIAQTSTGDWQFLSPGSGAITSLAINPDDPRRLFAAGDRLYASDNGGLDWHPVEGLDEPGCVGGVLFQPGDGHVLYTWSHDACGMSFSGIRKSTDGGVSWFDASSGLPDEPVEPVISVADLVMQADRPDTLYAVIRGHPLYRSDDGGASWHPLDGLADKDVVRLLIDPARPAVQYALVQQEDAARRSHVHALYRSDDGGEHWSMLPRVLDVRAIALSPWRTGELYAIHYDWPAPIGPGEHPEPTIELLRSDDRGDSWQRIADLTDSGCGHEALALAPRIPGLMLTDHPTGDGNVCRSTDFGQNWSADNWLGLYGAALSDVAFHPEQPELFYVATHNGVHVSADSGRSWSATSQGLREETRLLPTTDSDTLFVLTGQGSFRSDDGGYSWVELLDPGGRSLRINAIAGNDEILYASNGGGLYRSENGGLSWHQRSASGFDTDMYVSPHDPDHLLTSQSEPNTNPDERRLRISTDGGISWSDSDLPTGLRLVQGVAFHPDDPSRILISLVDTVLGAPDTIHESRDGGLIWSSWNGTGLERFSEIRIDPNDADRWFAIGNTRDGSSKGLMVSHDGGTSWSAVPVPGYDAVVRFDLTADPVTILYIATEQYGELPAILRSRDGGDSWETLATLPIPLSATQNSLLADPASPDRVLLGSPAGLLALNQTEVPETRGLMNVSTRGLVSDGEHTLRAGFIIQGDTPVTVLIKGEGAILNAPDAIRDPGFEVRDFFGEVVARNDNWQAAAGSGRIALMAPPAAAEEAALIATLPPGPYIAELGHADPRDGIGLVAVTDVRAFHGDRPEAIARGTGLVNLSTRGLVGPDPMTLGFIIQGGDPVRVLIKGEGPILNHPDALDDPELVLTDWAGEELMRNDGWRNHPSATEVAALAPPASDREAAFVIELEPGVYLAELRAKPGATGLGLLAITDVRAFDPEKR